MSGRGGKNPLPVTKRSEGLTGFGSAGGADLLPGLGLAANGGGGLTVCQSAVLV